MYFKFVFGASHRFTTNDFRTRYRTDGDCRAVNFIPTRTETRRHISAVFDRTRVMSAVCVCDASLLREKKNFFLQIFLRFPFSIRARSTPRPSGPHDSRVSLMSNERRRFRRNRYFRPAPFIRPTCTTLSFRVAPTSSGIHSPRRVLAWFVVDCSNVVCVYHRATYRSILTEFFPSLSHNKPLLPSEPNRWSHRSTTSCHQVRLRPRNRGTVRTVYEL